MTDHLNNPILGLMGRARSGKDTFATYLVRNHGFTRVAFADPLREIAAAVDPIVGYNDHGDVSPIRYSDAIDFYGYERAKDEFPEVRRFLQRLGTDGVRAFDGEFWVRLGAERVRKLAALGPVVVTDVRFPNEADALHALGGDLVRVVRGVPDPAEVLHDSETALDNYHADFTVLNHSTLAHLSQKADSIAHRLMHHATI